MRDIVLCFIGKMNLGASTISSVFKRDVPKGAVEAHDHTVPLGILWIVLIFIWEFIKRAAVIFALVVIPVSLHMNISETHRVGIFFTLLFFIQFIAGACSPLGRRHNEPPIPIISQIFWERMKDVLYMPFILYIFTSSMNVGVAWCLAITVELIGARLVCEMIFGYVADRMSLLKRGEDVLYIGLGGVSIAAGYAISISGIGSVVGRCMMSPVSVVLSAVLGAVSLFIIWRNY